MTLQEECKLLVQKIRAITSEEMEILQRVKTITDEQHTEEEWHLIAACLRDMIGLLDWLTGEVEDKDDGA